MGVEVCLQLTPACLQPLNTTLLRPVFPCKPRSGETHSQLFCGWEEEGCDLTIIQPILYSVGRRDIVYGMSVVLKKGSLIALQ